MNRKRAMVRRGRDNWRVIMGEQQASGLSVPAYCRQEKINTKTFYAWRDRLAKDRDPKKSGFIQIQRADVDSSKVIKIESPGGYRLEIPENADEACVKTALTILLGLR
jgi:hypothetical protein